MSCTIDDGSARKGGTGSLAPVFLHAAIPQIRFTDLPGAALPKGSGPGTGKTLPSAVLSMADGSNEKGNRIGKLRLSNEDLADG